MAVAGFGRTAPAWVLASAEAAPSVDGALIGVASASAGGYRGLSDDLRITE